MKSPAILIFILVAINVIAAYIPVDGSAYLIIMGIQLLNLGILLHVIRKRHLS